MNDSKQSNNKALNLKGMSFLTFQEALEIQKGFELLQISNSPHYSNPYQFSKDLQKASNLQYEGVRFFTSGSATIIKE